MSLRHAQPDEKAGLLSVDTSKDPEDQSPMRSPQHPTDMMSCQKKDENNLQRGYVFMVLLALQYGWQPLLTKECIGPQVGKQTVVIVQEISKLAIAYTMIMAEGGSIGWSKAINEANFGRPWTLRSSIEIAGPLSCLYAVQNCLLFYAAGNMDPLSFNLVNQTKLIWTALFVFVVMQKKQSTMQIVAIVMMMGSAAMLTMKPSKAEDIQEERSWDQEFFHGILPNLGAALISGLAGALSQKALQGVGRNSYLFTMELCVWQTLFLFVVTPVAQGAYSLYIGEAAAALAAQEAVVGGGFFAGWEWYTILPIVNNAAGGIFTGQVVKFAGGVRKGFAVIAALIMTSFFQRIYYGTPLTMQLYIALPVVVSANVIYGRYPLTSKPASNAK